MKNDIQDKLLAPFPAEDIGWLPQSVKGDKCLAVAYIDARSVQDRLDQVMGVSNWQDDYTVVDAGCMMCRLSLRFDKEWITRCDVGSPSEQKDEGDRMKSAVSDALKRAAVKFGVGRYLYRLPTFWVDFDPQKKRIVRPPALPDWAMPNHPSRSQILDLRDRLADHKKTDDSLISWLRDQGFTLPDGATLDDLSMSAFQKAMEVFKKRKKQTA